ncbi:MAG: dihydrofolate reductase [Pseudomonadota bacterium]
MLPIAIIVAAADNDVIGQDNQLPWHLPADLAHFKRTTLGKPVIMGRKTFDSIGRPLPGRPNIVVSRNADLKIDGVSTAGDLESAVELAHELAEDTKAEELMVIGGAEIYRQALPLAQRIYLTRVHERPVGDAFLVRLPEGDWSTEACERFPAEADKPAYSLLRLQRR